MATRKTLNFLPDVFKTTINKKFLGATLDQLISEPNLSRINAFIGRKFAPSYKFGDSYLQEPTTERTNYQLEPSIIAKNASLGIDHYSDYVDLLNKIDYYGGITENNDRLFTSEYYSYNPKIDLDKFVNFSQYYWMPNGPLPVTITSGQTGEAKTFVISRDVDGYTTDQSSTYNPNLVLVRGVTYTIEVDQPGSNFWIQTELGTSGFKQYDPAISSRNIKGVTNNGASTGQITFTVPLKDSQDYYFTMPSLSFVDYALTVPFSSLDGKKWNSGAGAVTSIDGDTDFPIGKYIIFLGGLTTDSNWQTSTGGLVPTEHRQGLWQINIDENSVISLDYIRNIPIGYKILINHGVTNTAAEFFKNPSGQIVTSPAITAPLSTLYYQDSQSSSLHGIINIVDMPSSVLDIENDILGKKLYISPNGVVFTNGLQITFDGTVPEFYKNKNFVIEGVGTGIILVDVASLVIPEVTIPVSSVPFDLYNFDIGSYDQTLLGSSSPDYIVINRASQDSNAWSRTNRWTHIDVIIKAAEYNQTIPILDQNARATRPIIEFLPNLQLFNNGQDSAGITDHFITDKNFSQVNLLTTKVVDLPLAEGQRIIFANDPNNIIRKTVYKVGFENNPTIGTFDVTGLGRISIDGSKVTGVNTTFLTQVKVGSYLYTAAGAYIGKVSNIYSNSILILYEPVTTPIISTLFKSNYARIILSVDVVAKEYDTTVVINGVNAKKTFWLKDNSWIISQLKTRTNQPPLFDAVDASGISFSNLAHYPITTFTGTKIFSYAIGNYLDDKVLGFPLSYITIGTSIGDINFDNNFDTDSFKYKQNGIFIEKNISTGFIADVFGTKSSVWDKVQSDSKQYQIISNVYTGKTKYFEIDILPADETTESNLKVFVNNKLIHTYTVETVGARNAVKIHTVPLTVNDRIDILIYSNEVSKLGYYQIPGNLDFNSKNVTMNNVTLGQVRNHLLKIGQGTIGIVGDVLAANNIRDTDIRYRSGSILQQSAPVMYSSLFLIDSQTNFVNSLDFSRREYTKFKNRFLELCISMSDLDKNNPMDGVDSVLSVINSVKNASFPWYYSDMVPNGSEYVTASHIVSNPSVKTYATIASYANLKISNQGILVYLNNKLLVLGQDYSFNVMPSLTLTSAVVLQVNDTLVIKQYSTVGNYIPQTPTKLGLYPKYTPQVLHDDTYETPIDVIQGHDGSLTPVFNDIRDAYLLELELRIFNNIKVDHSSNLIDIIKYVPGKYRDTEYSLSEFNQVLNSEFLKWIGATQVDYSTNSYFSSGNQFTWNYNESFDDTDIALPGYWRGIYKYYYDTDRPHTHPWEMLGHIDKPVWWDNYYSWTPGAKRTDLLTALRTGLVDEPPSTVTNVLYARPDIDTVIPVDANGNLVSPQVHIAKRFNSSTVDQSFSIGDQGPVESAWRRSSEFPFAMQFTLALLKPALYFSTQIDIPNYRRNVETTQIGFTATNKKITPSEITLNGELVNGSTSVTTGYLNWILDYLTSLGINSTTKLRGLLDAIDVKLSHRMAGYTDKKFITVLAEQYSPSSTNQSVIIPDENYSIKLVKSVPIRNATYSAVIVEKTDNGYTIGGYDITTPYFTIIPSDPAGQYYAISVLDERAVIFKKYKNEKINIPYGFEFTNKQQVVDFLVSYQRFLVAQGFTFQEYEPNLGQSKDWVLAANEFLTWSMQGWKSGNVIVLSPISDTLNIVSDDSVMDSITTRMYESRLLGPNFDSIRIEDINVVRETGSTQITTNSGKTIAFAKLAFVQFEHVLVFDNVTVFNDIIYKPDSGNRQYRLKLIGAKTADWTGALDPSGFIYSDSTVKTWAPYQDYLKADIVRYKNDNYTAMQNIAGSDAFDFNYWSILTREIPTGLMPNFSSLAVKSTDIYDIDEQPLDENFDKFSNGLIGYRSRSYLEALGMNQTTQSKFYQGYIKTKGTKNSISAIARGKFNEIASNITTYEDWAVRVGEYGSLNTNLSIDVSLKGHQFKSTKTNPIYFSLVDYRAAASATVVKPNELLSKPLKYSPNIFLNRTPAEYYESDILSAGYANVEDVDSLIFTMSNLLTAREILASLTNSYRIWVAKDFDKDWQVYKVFQADNTVISLEYALDNKIKITTSSPHGLSNGDVFAIRDIDSLLDGFYQVFNAEDAISMIVIVDADILLRSTITDVFGMIEGAGSLFYLQRSRFKSKEIFDATVPAAPWTTSDIVWVDHAELNQWAVYKLDSANAWNAIRKQEPAVNLSSVNDLYIFNEKTKELLTRLDYIDPFKGKILGVAQSDIDFLTSFDPAKYNYGTEEELPIDVDYYWSNLNLGMMWWDIDAVRYIDYEQDDLSYRLTNWGKAFPGSEIHVYEWISSDYIPSEYVTNNLEGIPKYPDDSAYSASVYVDPVTGVTKSKYYFWVRAKQSKVSTSKTYSSAALQSMIDSPMQQSIPYAAILRDNSVALYNVGEYLNNESAVLHIDYQVVINENIIHSEYELIKENSPRSRLPSRITNKIIDSIVGADAELNLVPDFRLSIMGKLGLSIRPRQTLIIARLKAVENVVKYVNTVMSQHVVSLRLTDNVSTYSDNFYAKEPLPFHTAYDVAVDTIDELNYLIVTANLKVLVKNDSTQGGYWTIYQANSENKFVLFKIQSFDVSKYWSFVDWYADGYSAKSKLTHTVAFERDLYKFNFVEGDVVKIQDNGKSLFEIYQYTSPTSRILVGLQKGTIKLSDSLWMSDGFDAAPFQEDSYDHNTFVELRYILQGLKQDVFVDDLETYYEKLLFNVIKFILAEQKTVDWIFKTSFISILHEIEGLSQSPVYAKDNQEFYQSYINEVKPYRTKIEQYVLSHATIDNINSVITDFDVPAYYDKISKTYRSPTLDDTDILKEPQYQDWLNNYSYNVESIAITSPGYGYTIAPDIEIVGDGIGAKARAVIDPLTKKITQIIVENPGKNYTTTPLVVIKGNGITQESYNSLPAAAAPRMANYKTRKIKTTIKFDRIQYTSRVIDWVPATTNNQSYPANSLVQFNGKVYTNSVVVPAANRFNYGVFKPVIAGSLDNANDRVMGYYQPTSTMEPRILSRLISGITLDSQVNSTEVVDRDTAISGGGFFGSSIAASQIVVGNTYIIITPGDTAFTSIGAVENSIGVIFTATGTATGTGTVTHAIMNDAFSNATGISPENIDLSGGTYVNRLFSHAPEELIPGMVFDTLMITVLDDQAGNLSYRMFTDINKSTSYTSADVNTDTALAEDFNIQDSEITVVDASNLPVPNTYALLPGIVYIRGERISYYTKNGNVLGQLRRGVGGTSTSMVYKAGTPVADVSSSLNISDETIA